MKKWSNTYYENHKDDSVKKYLDKTKERRLAYGKKYYEEHKEERLNYYQENKEKRQKYQREYAKKKRNPKKYFKDTLMGLLKKS